MEGIATRGWEIGGLAGHNDAGQDNANAHIQWQIMGREVMVAVTQGRLDFGTWEQIFYGESDRRRTKAVLAMVIAD